MFDNTNPYTIRIEEMNGQKRYFVAFVDGQGIFREAEVSYKVYAQFCRFVKCERNLRRSDERHLALMSYPIQNSCMSNCIVLDPFLGSGSTLIACEQTSRICYGIELDEKFVDVIVNRYIEQKGSAADVFLIRDGRKISYEDFIKGGTDHAPDDLP